MAQGQNTIKTITLENAERIHEVLAEYFNKSEPDPILPTGVREGGLLESALNRLNTSMFNKKGLTVEKYPDLDQKAAALLYGLIKNHPFYNGNKRTALAVCLVFYDINGATINATEKDLFSFITKIAAGKLDDCSDQGARLYSFKEIVDWLKKHKRIYLKNYGDINVKDFIYQCGLWGCTIKLVKGTWKVAVPSTRRSICFSQSTSRIDSAVAKRYLAELGLRLTLDDFLQNTIETNHKFKKILPVLRKLAFA